MRISGWHINGFGMFADYRLDDVPPGLTVLHGPNEAGKSTLVNYILSVLFGFADGRTKGPRYEPLAGGNYGGKLFLEDGNGTFVIERTKAGKVPMVKHPDGNTGGQEAIRDLLGGADRSLFQNVFAFGLKELEDLTALQGDSVRERIFATPTFGGGPSARDIIKRLESREKELLRPRSESTIYDLRMKLEHASDELSTLRSEAESYERSMRDLDEADEAVGEIQRALSEARSEADRYETFQNAWPHWSDRLALQEELVLIDVPDGLELATETRLREADQEIGELKAIVRERQENLERQESRLKRIVVDDSLPPIASNVKELHAAIRRYDQDRTDVGGLESKSERLQADVTRSLAELGEGWDKDRVEGFDLSIPVKGEFTDWRDRMNDAGAAAIEAARRQSDLDVRLGEVTAERAARETELNEYEATPSAEQIDKTEKKTRNLRIASRRVAELQERARADDQQAAAVQAAIDGMGSAPGLTAPPVALFAVPALLGAAGVIAAVAGEMLSAVLLVVLAVVSGVGIVLWRRTASSGATQMPQGLGTDRKPDREEEGLDLESAESRARDLATELGFPAIPTELEIEERLATISRQRTTRETADGVAKVVNGEREKERKLRGKIEDAKQEGELEKVAQQQLAADWDTWRTELGIPEPLKPEVVIDLLPAIAAARDLLAQAVATQAGIAEVSERIEQFEQSAIEALGTVNRDDSLRDAGLMAAVETLHQDVLVDEKQREAIEGLTTGVGGARKGFEAADADLAVAIEIRDRVLADAGVEDAAALEQAIAGLKRKADLEQEIARLTRLIDGAIGGGASGDAMKEELATGDLPGWSSRQDEASADVEQSEAEYEGAVRHHQDLKTAAKAIADSTEVARQALAVEAYRVELANATAEWARVATARALIDATLTRFERKHQPRVVERASELFDLVTNGRYPELMSTESALTVLSRAGDAVDVVNLSTGTVQQLYLCLRFALAEEFAGRGTKLPLVMDDVLVNFDPERAENVAGAIAEVADRYQVLMLTCHPGTRDLMAEVAPDARIVELEQFPR